MSDAHARIHEMLAADLERIARHFKARPRLTLLVRHPDNPNANILLSDDNLSEVVSAATALRADPAYLAGPSEPDPALPLLVDKFDSCLMCGHEFRRRT